MSPELDEILEKAMRLPADAREAFATSLFESLDQTVEEDLDSAWQEEIAKRVKQIQSRQVQPVSWEEVKKKGRSLLHEK